LVQRQRLLADMLRQRGHWLRYVLGHEPGALCERISKSLGEIVSDHLRAAAARTPDALRNQASSLPRVGTLGTDPQSLRALETTGFVDPDGKREWRKSHYQGTWTRIRELVFERGEGSSEVDD